MSKKKLLTFKQMLKDMKKESKLLKRFVGKNEDHLLFAAFLIVMTSLVVVNTIFIINKEPNRQNRISSGAISDSRRVLSTLQKANSDAFDVKVSNVTVTQKTDRAFSLVPEDTMLIMDIAITNNSSGTQQIVPANQFYVRDRQGGIYMLHPSSYVTNPLSLTNVDSGKVVNGQLSFAIPKILAHPLLYVDLGWNDDAPIVIDVMK